jgi:hypothetical protein
MSHFPDGFCGTAGANRTIDAGIPAFRSRIVQQQKPLPTIHDAGLGTTFDGSEVFSGPVEAERSIMV